ncbi:MAG: response regulator [Patescibacteria group bacterium]|nr:response regulator [Patescibacteria group bacterium]
MAKILLVEDDQILAKLYQTKFQREGMEIQLAYDGEEGFEKMKSYHPDVVILDLIMPKVDGFSFLAKVQADAELAGRKTPILVLSNLGQESDIKKAMDMGAKDFFIKADVSLSQMVEKVRKYL